MPVPRSRLAALLVSALAGLALVLAAMVPATAELSEVRADGPGSAETGGEEITGKISAAVTAALEADGRAGVWVHFAAEPQLATMAAVNGWEARGEAVHHRLTTVAKDSQARVRALLDAEGAKYHAFHITNAIKVEGASASLVQRLADLPEVSEVLPEFGVELIEPVATAPASEPTALTWGLSDIRADEAWARYGTTGEGIVVGTLDTGVDYTHPALVESYRGNDGDGTYTHDYSWFDANFGTQVPEDRDGHGTHVTGTMTGAAGGNQIGVAPGAEWMAMSGCCLRDDVDAVASMEWFLAPTRTDGTDPDPAMRPHVVNNSWGFTNYRGPIANDVIAAWDAAGIFGVFAAGNDGYSGCGSLISPGYQPPAYAVGNYRPDHSIGPQSSRGPGVSGDVKPNISAPGTGVRSSVPGGGYESWDGTSMAAPHVSGAVALLWSAVPDLRGDVETTRALLDQTAVDTSDLRCGGTAEDNNVFGEGRLDIVALIEAALSDPVEVERLSGTDRYATAAAISSTVAAGAPLVFVATGEAFPDALTGSARAGSVDAPVLLTRGARLPAATVDELVRLAPQKVVVLGGEAAVSADVAEEIRTLTGVPVDRWYGTDRYGTAAAVAARTATADVVYVATGADYPDALAASAKAGSVDAPVLLTKPGRVPEETLEQLDRLSPDSIIVLGGTAAVEDVVYDELRARYGAGVVERVSGGNRFDTAALLTATYPSAGTAYVASGLDWPDAMTGAARAAAEHEPLVLSRTDTIPPVSWAELLRLGPDAVAVLGGSAAVSEDVVAALRTLP